MSNEFATSGGHWYDSEGNPAYTQPNKSKEGETRPTTLRDAKKLNLVPSVTGILNMADKPALNRWKSNQIMMAALTLPQIEGESLKDFESRIWADSNAQSNEARDRGTEIHGYIEAHFAGNPISTHESIKFTAEVEAELFEIFGDQNYLPEKSFSSTLGYGGKVDLYSENVVIDYKTKDNKAFNGKPMSYPENIMQLSAYRKGLNLPNAKIANVFIGRDLQEDGTALVKIEVHEDDMWDRFECLLKYWKLTKGVE